MVDATLSITASRPVPATPVPPPPAFGRQLLSELNPLQYLPVVGTIYRATTGDTIPQTARIAGSLVLSALTGGPVGVALNVGSTLLEQLVGFDPETMGQRLLADIGIGSAPANAGHARTATQGGAVASAPASSAAAGPAAAVATNESSGQVSPGGSTGSVRAWTATQLAAYGISQGAGGTLTRGSLSGAEVLNTLELEQVTGTAVKADASAAA